MDFWRTSEQERQEVAKHLYGSERQEVAKHLYGSEAKALPLTSGVWFSVQTPSGLQTIGSELYCSAVAEMTPHRWDLYQDGAYWFTTQMSAPRYVIEDVCAYLSETETGPVTAEIASLEVAA